MTVATLSTVEVAARLGVDRRTVARWARAGLLACDGPASGRRFPVADLPEVPPGRLLKPGQVAALLGVDGRTLARLSDGGALRAVRTKGGHRRFVEAEVRAYAASRAASRSAS